MTAFNLYLFKFTILSLETFSKRDTITFRRQPRHQYIFFVVRVNFGNFFKKLRRVRGGLEGKWLYVYKLLIKK